MANDPATIGFMLLATAAAFLLSTSAGTKPNTYNERWLCDLWAGAQCHATSCQKDGKVRCEAVSKQCDSTDREATVDSRLVDSHCLETASQRTLPSFWQAVAWHCAPAQRSQSQRSV